MDTIETLFNAAKTTIHENDYNGTIEAIRQLAVAVHETDEDIDWSIGECSEFTLDSLIVGAYWFACHYYSGQWSELYSLQCTLGKVFSPNRSDLDPDSPEQYVYELLEGLHVT